MGSVLIANLRAGHPRGWFLIGGTLIAGLSLAVISGFAVFVVGVVAMIGIGIGEQARGALGQSLIMENTMDEYKSRVMSVLMMHYGLLPLGMLPLGWAMEAVGGRLVVSFNAAIVIVFVVLSVFFLPRLRAIR
ncbi:MAG: hypothetical protein QF922_05890, partial [SAR324 cluster bacterium]|nr:hypothetical protein [SAR324 cluster bacterium]